MDTGATEKFKKPYDPTEVEDPIYKKWEESGYFQPMADRPWADNSSDNPNYNKRKHLALRRKLRGKQTKTEAIIWEFLCKKKFMGLKFWQN